MNSDIKTATLKNRKTDLKEQNKRLPTIQETNACWQITNLSFTYLWCLVSPTHFQRLLMCSNTLAYWCCCLLFKKQHWNHGSSKLPHILHNFVSQMLHHNKMKWLPNLIHEMQIALGNVGNKSHSRPHQCTWLSRHAQKWYQNWHYRSNVSFHLKFTKLSLWMQSSFLHTIRHKAHRYYNYQMAKYKVGSAIASWWSEETDTTHVSLVEVKKLQLYQLKVMRKILADVAHSLSHLSNGKFMNLHSPNLIM